MERKEQTGHICRWMALGIMTAIVIIGCTIVIGLFEWRDRKEIECRNAELHQWRKNVHDLNLHITELSLLGEMVADWDSTDVNELLRWITGLTKQHHLSSKILRYYSHWLRLVFM